MSGMSRHPCNEEQTANVTKPQLKHYSRHPSKRIHISSQPTGLYKCARGVSVLVNHISSKWSQQSQTKPIEAVVPFQCP